MYEKEDTDLLCQYIVFDHVLKFLLSEVEAIEDSKIRVKAPYFNFLQSKVKKCHTEFRSLKQQIREREIKIHDMVDRGYEVEYPVTCRGYFFQWDMDKVSLRLRVKKKLSELYQSNM